MSKNTKLKKLARHLLATTCLTAGTAALANAQIVTEGISPAPADFGDDFRAAYLLPDGTTEVNGTVELSNDRSDFFTFQGLPAGGNFSFTATSTKALVIGLILLDSSDRQIGLPEDFFSFSSAESASGSGAVPSDGTLTFDLSIIGDMTQEPLRPYTVDLSATQASTTPEPGTLGVTGLGLAAGAVLVRRRRKKA